MHHHHAQIARATLDERALLRAQNHHLTHHISAAGPRLRRRIALGLLRLARAVEPRLDPLEVASRPCAVGSTSRG